MIQNKLLSVDLCSKKKPKTFRIKSVFQGLYPGTAFLKEQCSVAVFSVRDFTTADKRTHTRMQARTHPPTHPHTHTHTHTHTLQRHETATVR